MAYVNVADWNPEQVAEWLKGLDNIVLPYIRMFIEKNVNGQRLLDLQPADLEAIGVYKIGHQEIILEAVELLKNFYYDLDRENAQLLALRLSCLAHSLHSELWKNHINSSVVSTQVLADVANVVSAVKPLVCWLDRPPFCDQTSYVDKKNEFLKLSLEMAMSGMRDRFVDKPIEYIRQSCKQLAELADTLIQSEDDSLLLQPASLDLATLKKRPGDHLDFYVVPSFHGILQVGELKCNSAAHQSGKIETGDEIVQINYQTVVGWEVKDVMSLLFEESSTEVLITLKKRPRHSKVFGQIYIKPYRLPSKKQMSYSTRWSDLLSPSRPELLTVTPNFVPSLRMLNVNQAITNVTETQEIKHISPPSPTPSTVSNVSSQSSESELMAGPSSPNSVRLYLPKPRIPVQRRATITGASPVSKHAPLSLEQFWRELKLEREWRSNSDEKTSGKSNSEIQLKGSPPIVHSSLSWSAHLCEHRDIDDEIVKNKLHSDDKNTNRNDKGNSIESGGIVPIKQRIDSLNRSIEQNAFAAKKPKLLPKPKPILLNRYVTSAAPKSSSKKISSQPILAKDSDSIRRERGKLDKSYSTPSYDYSYDSKEPLTFNTRLPEEKVKSAPDAIAADPNPLTEFKASLEAKKKADEHRVEAVVEYDDRMHNDYLEIKSDESDATIAKLASVHGKETDRKVSDTAVNLSMTINTSENIAVENICPFVENVTASSTSIEQKSKVVPFSLEDIVSPPVELKPKIDPFIISEGNVSSKLDEENLLAAGSSLPLTENLIIHTTINVPATFPRHKVEAKKPISPPEPPPRPNRVSPVHSKTVKSPTVTKSFSKSVPHKSPKTTRKKNVLLTKRRNISVKELGVCDYEGWLYHRVRKMSRGSPQWIKGWFIIKGTIFYGFNSPEANRARLMISLPGFTVSPAEEVKSRNYSFKVYHTGTTFYFAAESGEDLAAWVESFSRVTVSDEELSIVVSETDGEEEDESQPPKKEKHANESYSPHVAAMKKLTGLLSLSTQEWSNRGEKKFNSLKKSASQKSNKEDHQVENNHVASLDRKYLKFLSGSGRQNFVPVPTAQFRSYRRVPPMEKSLQNFQEGGLQSSDAKSDSITNAAPLPSTSPTRPPDMADYRLASLPKANANNQRNLEAPHPAGYMTLESFMLSRQEEERRHQLQHPRAANLLRVPQCHAPPPPTPIASHNVAAVTGHETFPSPRSNARSRVGAASNVASSSGKNWPDGANQGGKSIDGSRGATTGNNFRSKHLKKTTQYQPPPWDSPVLGHSEESRLQPAFEMTLDRHFSTSDNLNGAAAVTAAMSSSRNTNETSSSGTSLKFKHLFGNTKTDGHKTTLISSPRLRRVLFRDKKNQTHPIPVMVPTQVDWNLSIENPNPAIALTSLEGRLPNAPDYPGLEYPPVFEPGTYSLSDMSTLLRNCTVRQSSNANDDGRKSTSLSNINEIMLDEAARDDDTVNNNEIGLSPPPPYHDAQNYPNRDPHYYNDL